MGLCCSVNLDGNALYVQFRWAYISIDFWIGISLYIDYDYPEESTRNHTDDDTKETTIEHYLLAID